MQDVKNCNFIGIALYGAKLIVLGDEFEKNLLQNGYLNNTYKLLYNHHSYATLLLLVQRRNPATKAAPAAAMATTISGISKNASATATAVPAIAV